MKRNNLIVISVVVLAILFGLAIFIVKSNSESTTVVRIPQEKLVTAYSPSLGNPQAKVTVVEFLDPECGACAALSPMVKGLVNDYKDRIHFVVRYMLLHGNSKPAAQAIEAARKQDKYWEMLAQLFFRREWAGQEGSQEAFFEKVAKDLSLDLAKFKADSQDAQIILNIANDSAEAPLLGVQGTPSFFVNGRLLPGISYESLKKAIDDELAANN